IAVLTVVSSSGSDYNLLEEIGPFRTLTCRRESVQSQNVFDCHDLCINGCTKRINMCKRSWGHLEKR
ncbi:MAG: hypothetical protein ACKPKO_62510, partial [Candidatus Fonsibacter sp.]